MESKEDYVQIGAVQMHISEIASWPIELRRHVKEVANVVKEYIDKSPHYNRGRIEVRDFIVDQQLCFQGGNVVKYVCRAGFKETTSKISDLKKAQNYLNNYIKYLEGREEGIT